MPQINMIKMNTLNLPQNTLPLNTTSVQPQSAEMPSSRKPLMLLSEGIESARHAAASCVVITLNESEVMFRFHRISEAIRAFSNRAARYVYFYAAEIQFRNEKVTR